MSMIKNLVVVTKSVLIENESFVLVSFDTPVNLRDYYGARVYGLVARDFIDCSGRLSRRVSGADLSLSSTPAGAIDRKRKDILAFRWRQSHPDSTIMEFANYVLSLG